MSRGKRKFKRHHDPLGEWALLDPAAPHPARVVFHTVEEEIEFLKGIDGGDNDNFRNPPLEHIHITFPKIQIGGDGEITCQEGVEWKLTPATVTLNDGSTDQSYQVYGISRVKFWYRGTEAIMCDFVFSRSPEEWYEIWLGDLKYRETAFVKIEKATITPLSDRERGSAKWKHFKEIVGSDAFIQQWRCDDYPQAETVLMWTLEALGNPKVIKKQRKACAKCDRKRKVEVVDETHIGDEDIYTQLNAIRLRYDPAPKTTRKGTPHSYEYERIGYIRKYKNGKKVFVRPTICCKGRGKRIEHEYIKRRSNGGT